MSTNTVFFTVEDIDTQILTFQSMQVERATAADGAFANITTITLVADQTEYEYEDTTGSFTSWYRYRFYHTTGPVASSYSNPFRVELGNITRAVVRQRMITDYDAGVVLTAAAGSDTDTVKVSDYRVGSSLYSTLRGVGTWLMPASGTYIGVITKVTVSAPTASPPYFDVSPAIGGGVTAGDTIEWHWLASPDVINMCMNRALRRYVYVERIPVLGQGTPEMNLSYLAWLRKRRQVAGLWDTPVSGYEEQPFTGWWTTREDNGRVYITTRPKVETTDTFYLEAFRTADEVFTDNSVIPDGVNWELLAAMTYEEVLKFLTRPGSAAASADRLVWEKELDSHRKETLPRLARRERPRVRYQKQQTPQVTKASTFWRAR